MIFVDFFFVGVIGLVFVGGGDWWFELVGFGICEFCLDVICVVDWVWGFILSFLIGVVELIIIDGGRVVVGGVEGWVVVFLFVDLGFLCSILLIKEK